MGAHWGMTKTTATTKTTRCGRCSGEGYIAAFSHIAGGRCLACKGTGTVTRYTAAGRAAAADREARHAALSHAAAAADAELRPSLRHHAKDLSQLEATDPAGYEAALASVVLTHAYDPSNRRPPGVCRCGKRVQDPVHS